MARLNQGPRSDECLRSGESPMDFTWAEGHGPVPNDSPFMHGAATQRNFNTWSGMKRPASALDSPSKPFLPALRAAENQTYLFPSTPAGKPQFRNTSFTTPQKTIDTDFSSGPEQSSPAGADTEDTPDPPARSGLSKSVGIMIPFEGSKAGKKLPALGLYDKSTGSGRGEIPRKGYTEKVVQKVHKRRRQNADRDVRQASRRSSNDLDSEERPSSSEGSQQKPPSVQRLNFIPSVLTFIDAHPNLPSTLSYYVQFILNCFFAFCMMYVLYGVYSTINNDIDERVMMESSEIFAEMAACAHEFQANRCERHTRVPAMETVCNNWEKCMQRDPYKVGRSRLSAGMFAEIFNSFIEPISLKAIMVSVSVIVGCFAVNNLTFGLLRAKHDQHQPPPHTPYMHPPRQQQMGWPPVNEHYYTPYRNYLGAPGMGQGGFQLEGQSPTKRLGYQ